MGYKLLITTLIATLVALVLMAVGLGIKMLCGKEREFKRPCANADPLTGRCTHCTCGKRPSPTPDTNPD